MSDIPIKEYIDRRFEEQEKAVKAALAAADKGVAAALSSAEKAVDKAEANTRKWQDASNEWRSAMNDRERDFLSRKEFYTMVTTAVAVTLLFLGLKR